MSSVDEKSRINEKRQFYEEFWRIFSVFISILFIILSSKVYQFQTNPIFALYSKGNFTQITLAIPVSLFIAAIRSFVSHKFLNQAESMICEERFPLKQKRLQRARTHCKWIVDIPYYGITTIISYLILKDLPNMPWYLGGSGECSNNYKNFLDFQHKSPLIIGFYVIQFGQHLYSFAAHLIDRSPEKFYQMLLHHSLSIMLITMSYLSNQVLVGIMVLFLHDSTDTFLLMGRYYGDLKNKNKCVMHMIYIWATALWIVFRLVAFPVCCIYESYIGVEYIYTLPQQMQTTILIPGLFMILMMCGLLIMHVFWTYFIISTFTTYMTKKKVSTRSY